ncbi:hypothetical protein Q1695_002324 [Nippostrongylus brasiliensis]|nr:hypothetical protein Q1695_002324 [Nippostrongylus brasiliensis]
MMPEFSGGNLPSGKFANSESLAMTSRNLYELHAPSAEPPGEPPEIAPIQAIPLFAQPTSPYFVLRVGRHAIKTSLKSDHSSRPGTQNGLQQVSFAQSTSQQSLAKPGNNFSLLLIALVALLATTAQGYYTYYYYYPSNNNNAGTTYYYNPNGYNYNTNNNGYYYNNNNGYYYDSGSSYYTPTTYTYTYPYYYYTYGRK